MYVSNDRDPLALRFEEFIRNPEFPCVGAKAALAKSRLETFMARDITSSWDDLRIYPALLEFVDRYRKEPDLFRSFAVIFEQPQALSEREFEKHLWERLQSFSDKDDFNAHPYDDSVSQNPDDPHFSLSFGGEAFFVVGLHPNASRPARRFQKPVMVFNLHAQFERLRAEGRYQKMHDTIMQRDVALAGDTNPMLAPFGTSSEARQYSGRIVGEDWVCPFSSRKSGGPS